MSKELIYILDDEDNIRELIKMNLEYQEYRVKIFSNGKEFMEELKLGIKPDLVTLDLMLPDIDGITICKKIKEIDPSILVMIISAKTTEFDAVIGLESGADDYVKKPFSVNEFIARIRSLLRRAQNLKNNDKDEVIILKDLRIDPRKYTVYKKEEKVELTQTEFEILMLLVKNNGNIVSRDSILDSVWGIDHFGDNRTVDVHIHNLRKSLREDIYIETVRGVGYRIKE